MEKSYNGFRLVWRFMLVYLVVSNILIYIIGLAADLDNTAVLYIAAELSQLPVLVFVCFFIKLKFPSENASQLFGFRGFDKRLIPLMIILPPVLQSAISVATIPVQTVITGIFGTYSADIPPLSSWTEAVCAFAGLCVLTPVVEELFFRGVITRLLKPYGLTVYVLASALAFALMHLDITAFCTVFILGIAMAFIRLGTDSIFPTMIFHASNNLVSLLMSVFAARIEAHPAIDTAVFVLELAACPVIIWAAYRLLTEKRSISEVMELPAREKTELSAGLIIFILIYALYAVIPLFAGKLL